MKIYYIIFIALLSVYTVNAQTELPQAFSFQGIAMDQSGDILFDTDLTVTILMEQNGSEIYGEAHDLTTTGLGHVNLEIGRGNILSGNFSEINWSGEKSILSFRSKTSKPTAFHFDATVCTPNVN